MESLEILYFERVGPGVEVVVGDEGVGWAALR